jgi:hypothetical protein
MSFQSRTIAGCVAVALLLSACGSTKSATDTTISSASTTTIPANIVDSGAKVKFTQIWSGDSVSLLLTDSKGRNCVGLSAIEGEECFGFYFGWTANFEDKDRVVNYEDGIYTTISGLQPGDGGTFDLLHVADDSSPQYKVREYAFAYNG